MTASPVRLGTEMVQVQDFDQEAVEDPTPVGPSSYASNAEWVNKAEKKLFKLPNGWTKAQIRSALEEWLGGPPYFQTPTEERIVKKARKILGDPPNIPGGPTNSTPTVANPAVYQVDSYKLNWYTNHNIAADIDDLAAATPFDWCMTHYWSDEGDEADLIHHIRIGYPKLGRYLTDLRFVLGENIHEVPSIERDGTEYASEVIVLGNGEGAAMIRGRAFRATPGRMRRTITVTDQNLTTVEACNARATEELAARATLEELSEVILIEHPHAPVGSVRVGDEFLLEGKTDWVDMSVNVRCVGRRFSPDDSSVVTLTVIRTDRLGGGYGNIDGTDVKGGSANDSIQID